MKNVALFIDCDRLEVAFMTVIFDYFRNQGYNICVKKAYITKESLDSWYNQLEKHCFRVVLGNNQESSDMKLSVDVAKAVYTGNYDSVAIASNYREFAVLASEIQSHALESICFYQYSKGNEAVLKRAYNTIYNLEPNKERDGFVEVTEGGTDLLAALESAIEGLDSKMLEERLANDEAMHAKKASEVAKEDADGLDELGSLLDALDENVLEEKLLEKKHARAARKPRKTASTKRKK